MIRYVNRVDEDKVGRVVGQVNRVGEGEGEGGRVIE